MTTLIVLVVVVVLIAAAGGDSRPGPSREQLRRDTEDIAVYGAVVRPRLEDAHDAEDDLL